MIEKSYGKSIENPVLLSSVSNSRIFLNSLVATQGDFMIYHRIDHTLNSEKAIVDHYEIMTDKKNVDFKL
jgi:hypothetical protein